MIADGAAMRLVLQGDANGDRRINATDYMLVKRNVLQTFLLSPVFARAMRLAGNEKINATDYMLLKRAVLGTYKLSPPLPPKNS